MKKSKGPQIKTKTCEFARSECYHLYTEACKSQWQTTMCSEIHQVASQRAWILQSSEWTTSQLEGHKSSH